MTQTLTDPAADPARGLIATGVQTDALVTVFGRCTVEYEGRARSELGPGDRHLMLKPDGTALVHTNTDQKPVNWQPPGGEHTVTATDELVKITSTRSSPAERLQVSFQSVAHVGVFDGTDEADLALAGTEADLRERILDTPDLIETGFQPQAIERETAAGAVDIYGRDAAGRTVVVELKRRRVGPDAVGQLNRYVNALNRELHAEADIRGILAAPSVTDRAHRLLAENGLEFVAVSPSKKQD